MSQTKMLMLCDKDNRLVGTAVEYFSRMLGEDLFIEADLETISQKILVGRNVII